MYLSSTCPTGVALRRRGSGQFRQVGLCACPRGGHGQGTEGARRVPLFPRRHPTPPLRLPLRLALVQQRLGTREAGAFLTPKPPPLFKAARVSLAGIEKTYMQRLLSHGGLGA